MSKKAAVVEGLSELGGHATPTQLRQHIKGHYGIDMTLKHISTAKAKINKEANAHRSVATKPAAKSPTKLPSAHNTVSSGELPKRGATAPKRATHSSISLHDIEAIKDLLERVGASSLRKLIDVMAR
jgi:hypothetical protein